MLGLVCYVTKNCCQTDKDIEDVCQKSNRKSNALARVTDYMEIPKRIILVKDNPISLYHYSIFIVNVK